MNYITQKILINSGLIYNSRELYQDDTYCTDTHDKYGRWANIELVYISENTYLLHIRKSNGETCHKFIHYVEELQLLIYAFDIEMLIKI